jgi:hypothetical protein
LHARGLRGSCADPRNIGCAWPLWLSGDVRRHRDAIRAIRAFRTGQLGLVPTNENTFRL